MLGHADHFIGKVAVKVSEYTIRKITQVWQPGHEADVRPTLAGILDALHHPYNMSPESEVQQLMFAEVLAYLKTRSERDPEGFDAMLPRLDKAHVAAKLGEEAAHTHADELTTAQAPAFEEAETAAPDHTTAHVRTPAHTLTTLPPENVQGLFATRISDNIASSVREGIIPGLSLDDIPGLRELMSMTSSSDNPNPIDQALTKVTGVGLLPAFKDIEIHDIISAPGMGNVLKEAVITMMMRDPERMEWEEKRATERFGGLAMSPAKEAQALLDFNAVDKYEEEGGTVSGGSKTAFMKRALEKLKIKS